MRQAIILALCVGTVLTAAARIVGYWQAYHLTYGAIFFMALMISGTFLWLWRRRTTPLALGMAFSWAGSASVLGWWWAYNALGRPEAMRENLVLFPFLGLYVTGAILHFAVIGRSLGWPRHVWALPPIAALVFSAPVL